MIILSSRFLITLQVFFKQQDRFIQRGVYTYSF